MVNKLLSYKENPEYINQSLEEEYILWYFLELQEAGYVKKVSKGISIELYPKVTFTVPRFSKIGKQLKPQVKILLGNKSYTPDFIIEWEQKAVDDNIVWKDFDYPFYVNKNAESTIEVKPDYDVKGISTREFKSTQKIAYHSIGLYVQCVIPVELFKKTFTPKRYLKCTLSNKQNRKLNYTPRTLEDWIKTL